MINKKLGAGYIQDIPGTRISNYNFWSIKQQKPLFHGGNGYTYGVDQNFPLKITLISNNYSDGLRCGLVKSPYTNSNFRYNNFDFNQCSKLESPVDFGISSQTVVDLSDTAYEVSISAYGSAILGDYHRDGGLQNSLNLSEFDNRYRLSAGLSLSEPRNVFLNIDNITDTFGTMEIACGDENGIAYPVYRSSIDSALVPCTVGPYEPVYIYTKSYSRELPTDIETSNSRYNDCVLFIRSDSTDGNSVLSDSSPDTRELTHNVTHSIDRKIFGDTSIKFKDKLSYIIVDNTDDGLACSGDFTLRLHLKSSNISSDKNYRLFYFNDNNYLDLTGTCAVEGVICGASMSGNSATGNWNEWTELSMIRKNSNIYIGINGKCIANAESKEMFGGSFIYSSDVTTDGVAFTDIDVFYNSTSIDAIFGSCTSSNSFNTGADYEGKLNFGYDFTEGNEKIIKAYAMRHRGYYDREEWSPTAWMFQGSYDGVNWDVLDTRQGEYIWGDAWFQYECGNNNNAYRYYQIVVTQTYGMVNRVSIGCIEFYEEATENEQDTLIIGTNDQENVWSFIGNIEELQFNHKAIEDDLGRLNNGANYNHPGLPELTYPEFSIFDREGYKSKIEEFSIIKLTESSITGSAELAGYEASKAIDGNESTYWDPNATTGYIQLDSTKRYSRCCKYNITIPTGNQTNAPTAWTLEGYNGSSWILLDQRSGITAWLDGEEKTFSFKRKDTSFESYKLSITAIDGGTSINISEFDLIDVSKYTIDQEYSPNTLKSVSASGVRSGELHISANDQWDVNGDENTISGKGFLLELKNASDDQILIDNTGRNASAYQLVKVDNISWATPAKLSFNGEEIFYRFISSGFITSETVDSSILLRINLPSDELIIVNVDTATTPSAFLTEEEVLIDSSEDGDSTPYTKLDSSVSTISVDNIGIPLIDGNLQYPAISNIDIASYKTWDIIGEYTTNSNYYWEVDNDGVYSAKDHTHALFEGISAANQYREGATTYLYDSFSNKYWRVADRPVYTNLDSNDYSAHAAMTYSDDLFWSYGGFFRVNDSSAYRSWLHSYNKYDNTWNVDLSDGPISIWKHSMSAVSSKLYSIGGHDGTDSMDGIYIYDISTDVWSTNATPAVHVNHLIRTTDWGDKVMTLGGALPTVAGQCDLNSFDTTTDTDSNINTDCSCGFRKGFDTSRLENRWYLTGNELSTDMQDTWYCDLTTNTFIRTIDETIDDNRFPAFEVFNKYALNIKGGTKYVRSFARIQSDFARYDERTDLSEIGYRATYTVNSGLRTGDKPYIWACGGNNTDNSQLFDILENQWIPLPVCPISHSKAAGGIYDLTDPKGVIWYNNSLYEYNFDTRSWTNPAVTNGSNQSSTYDFASIIHNDKLYMYGGYDSGSPSSKLFIIDLITRTMSELTLSGTTPPASMGGSLIFANYDGNTKNSLLLFNGSDGTGAYYTGDVSLQTTVLKMAGNVVADHGCNVVRVDEFQGDFKIDLAISDMSTMTTSGDKLLMELIIDPDHIVNVGINGMLWTYWDGENTVTTTRTNTYGSIRIERTGSTIEYSYLDGPGSWTSLGTSELANNDVKLVIRGIFDSDTKYVDLDTFTVDDVIEDDFSGTGDPSDIWAVNVDIYGQINRITDIYEIDPYTGVCSTHTPTIIPQGETTSLNYYDKNISGGRTRILSIDILNFVYELNLDTYDWELIEFSNDPPRMGNGRIFSYTTIEDTYDIPVFVIGQGDVGSAQTALANIAHQEWVMDISLSGSVSPEYFSLSYEPFYDTVDKMDLSVDGYNGSVWKNIANIPASVVNRTGKAYKLYNEENLTALKIKGRYGIGTHISPVFISSVNLLNNVKFGRLTQGEVEINKTEVEVLCPSVSDNMPTTTFGSFGTTTSTSQVYIAKELSLKGLYKSASDPGSYPYSVYYTTNDNTNMTLSLTEINSVVVNSLGNVKLAFSFDGRVTWVTYDSGWVSIDISNEATFRTNGIIADNIIDIPLSAWEPYIDGTVDVSVLLSLEDSSDYAYFNTIAFIGPDDEEGKRILTPINNWLSTILNPNNNIKIRSFTDIGTSTPSEIFNRYNWSTGLHSDNVSALTESYKSIHNILSKYNPEYMWAAMRNDGGNVPSLPVSGSFLRTDTAFDMFDYATNVLTRLEGVTYSEEESNFLRRSFGNNGIIRMTYVTVSDLSVTEIIDSASMTIQKDIAQTYEAIGGNGATLANNEYSWLTPGYLNDASKNWYNTMIKVDYSNIQRYLNARCNISESVSSACGAVSDAKDYGWIAGPSATSGYYSILKLDYSNDTTGLTEPCSVDVTDLGTNLYKSVGCSTPTKTNGYFWLNHKYINSTNVFRMVKLRFSTDTTYESFRTDSSENGTISNAVNPQARSMGHTSIYFWTNQADIIGPTELDLSTDTLSKRPSIGYISGSSYCSQYCGSQTCGLNY